MVFFSGVRCIYVDAMNIYYGTFSRKLPLCSLAQFLRFTADCNTEEVGVWTKILLFSDWYWRRDTRITDLYYRLCESWGNGFPPTHITKHIKDQLFLCERRWVRHRGLFLQIPTCFRHCFSTILSQTFSLRVSWRWVRCLRNVRSPIHTLGIAWSTGVNLALPEHPW